MQASSDMFGNARVRQDACSACRDKVEVRKEGVRHREEATRGGVGERNALDSDTTVAPLTRDSRKMRKM